MSAIWVAIIVAILGPMGLTLLSDWQRRRDRRETYAREDAVAARAQEVADKAAEAAGLLLAANERVARDTEASGKKLDGKLDKIHTLVNSNMTSAMQSELDALTANRVLMQEVIDLKIAAGQQPSVFAETAIAATETKISELTAKIADRLHE